MTSVVYKLSNIVKVILAVYLLFKIVFFHCLVESVLSGQNESYRFLIIMV